MGSLCWVVRLATNFVTNVIAAHIRPSQCTSMQFECSILVIPNLCAYIANNPMVSIAMIGTVPIFFRLCSLQIIVCVCVIICVCLCELKCSMFTWSRFFWITFIYPKNPPNRFCFTRIAHAIYLSPIVAVFFCIGILFQLIEYRRHARFSFHFIFTIQSIS